MANSSEFHKHLSAADEVDALILTARRVRTLDPSLETVFSKHKELFREVLYRQINLLRSRSQALEDAHVTVYDKVLLALTSPGNDIDNPAAITWYCSEYFGFNPDVARDHNTRAIEQGLAFPVALAQGTRITTSALAAIPEDIKLATPAPTSPIQNQDATWSMKDDANWQRFCDLYEDALHDFNSVAGERTSKAHEAARWLRDTAENGIHFLQRFSGVEDHRIRSLKDTYTMAQRVVEDMAGGKKRKFDHYADLKKERASDVKTEGPTRDHASEARYKTSTRELFPDRTKKTSSSSAAAAAAATRRDYRHSGRGPSGIPYGYADTRYVDSYVPARDNPDARKYARRRRAEH